MRKVVWSAQYVGSVTLRHTRATVRWPLLPSTPLTTLLGIGESKQGLPLGRLSIQIITITMPAHEMDLLSNESIVRVRVDIKGDKTVLRRWSILSFNIILIYLIFHILDKIDFVYTSIHLFVWLLSSVCSVGMKAGGVAAGPPLGPKSYTDGVRINEGITNINESLGTSLTWKYVGLSLYFSLVRLLVFYLLISIISQKAFWSAHTSLLTAPLPLPLFLFVRSLCSSPDSRCRDLCRSSKHEPKWVSKTIYYDMIW